MDNRILALDERERCLSSVTLSFYFNYPAWDTPYSASVPSAPSLRRDISSNIVKRVLLRHKSRKPSHPPSSFNTVEVRTAFDNTTNQRPSISSTPLSIPDLSYTSNCTRTMTIHEQTPTFKTMTGHVILVVKE